MSKTFARGDSVLVKSPSESFHSILLMSPVTTESGNTIGSVLTPNGGRDALYDGADWTIQDYNSSISDDNRFQTTGSDKTDYNGDYDELDLSTLPTAIESAADKATVIIATAQSYFDYAKSVANYLASMKVEKVSMLTDEDLTYLMDKLSNVAIEEDADVEVDIELKEESDHEMATIEFTNSDFDMNDLLKISEDFNSNDIITLDPQPGRLELVIPGFEYVQKATDLLDRVYKHVTYKVIKWDQDVLEESRKETFIFKRIDSLDITEQKQIIDLLWSLYPGDDLEAKFITDSKIEISFGYDDSKHEGSEEIGYTMFKALMDNKFFMLKSGALSEESLDSAASLVEEEAKAFSLDDELNDLKTLIDNMDTVNLIKIATGDIDIKQIVTDVLDKRGLPVRKLKQILKGS